MNESLILSSSTSSAVCLSLSFSVSGSACYRSRVTARLCRANFPAHGIRWTSFYLPQTDTSDCLLRAFMKRYVGVCLQRRFEFEVLFANYPNAFFHNIKVLLPNWNFLIWSLTHNILHVFRCLNSTYLLVSAHSNVLLLSVVYQINSLGQTCCFIQQSDA